MKLRIFIGIIIFQFAAFAITAQTTEFSYQGNLKDGANQANGNYDFEFRLFEALPAGTQIGPLMTRTNVAVANGTFAVKLDFGNFFNGADRFLEIRVRNAGGTGFTVLDPRQRVGSSPYAVKSLLAETANTANSATTATNATQLGGQAAAFYQNAANLNAGTLDAARLPVPLSLTGSVAGAGIISGTNSSTTGRGVYGNATAGSGVSQGVYGQSSSTSGIGVSGNATATTGAGETYGVYGRSSSPFGYGVYGTNADNVGVFGAATGTTGINYAGRFESDSTSGYGVFGYATAATGVTHGVFGRSDSPDGYAGYFQGRAHFSGNVGLGVQTPTFRLHLLTDSAAKPTSSSWTISSDRRLKKNIRTIDGALDKLMHLRGVTYQWRDPASQGDMAGTYPGMIAQDVEKVFPEWIRDDANGFKTLTVIGFEGIVVEALRELRAEKDAEISSQQAQIERQQTQINELKLIVCELKPMANGCPQK